MYFKEGKKSKKVKKSKEVKKYRGAQNQSTLFILLFINLGEKKLFALSAFLFTVPFQSVQSVQSSQPSQSSSVTYYTSEPRSLFER